MGVEAAAEAVDTELVVAEGRWSNRFGVVSQSRRVPVQTWASVVALRNILVAAEVLDSKVQMAHSMSVEEQSTQNTLLRHDTIQNVSKE